MTNWDRIVTEYGPVVFGTAWRILGHAADTEDVVQEVFLQAYQARQGQLVHCWETFLRRLATSRALERLRQRRPIPASIADNAVESEPSERLRQAVARLSHSEAIVFCLNCFEGFECEKIAETLQITVGAVDLSLHKARSRLETMMLESARQKLVRPRTGLAGEPTVRNELL